MAARRARPGTPRDADGAGSNWRDVRRRGGGEWLRNIEHERERKPSTVADYNALVRSQLLPAFGEQPIESITTPMIEEWLADVDRSSSTRTKSLVLLHGIFKRARKLYGLPVNPAVDVEKPSPRRSGDIEVFSPEDVMALVRAASSEQHAAIFLNCGVHGLAPWRAARAALARRRLRRPCDPRSRATRRAC